MTVWLVRRARAPLGRRGERVAARWLRRRGYRILRRNLTLARDEADLVALDPDGRTIVIVEVKTRSGTDVPPEAGIDRRKQWRLARLASRLAATGPYAERPFRFDTVSIVWADRTPPVVRHVVGAFDAP